MKRVIINAICALVLMLIQTNVGSAFGMNVVCEFFVIAAVISGATSMPMISSCLSMLALALLMDFFVSGPIGLYAFACMSVFAISRALLNRFRSERLISVMFWASLICIVFEAIQAALYSLYYFDTQYWKIYGNIFWIDALLTALMTPFVMWIEHLLERLFSRRHSNGLN